MHTKKCSAKRQFLLALRRRGELRFDDLFMVICSKGYMDVGSQRAYLNQLVIAGLVHKRVCDYDHAAFMYSITSKGLFVLENVY